MILLDTHIFLYQALGSDALATKRRELLQAVHDRIAISVVTVWELIVLTQKGRIVIPGDSVVDAVRDMVEAAGSTVLPLTAPIVYAARSLPFQHEDPADRFVAATAVVQGCPLMTDDSKLRELDWLHTV